MDSLPVETLQHIGSFLPFTERRTTFPLISKAFAEAAACEALGDLWASVNIDAPTHAATCKPAALQDMLAWLAPRADQVEHLRVDCRALPSAQGSFLQLLSVFRRSRNLRCLRVTGCDGVSVAAAVPLLAGFSRVQELCIEELDGFCDHSVTLQALSSMTNLQSLAISLREGFLHTWPDLARLHRLETLELSGCPAYGQPWAAWAVLPGWMTQLIALRSFSIRCAGWTEVPSLIVELTQLTALAIEDCPLGSPACPAGQLPCEARQLPAGFHRLTNLKSLSLGNWSGSTLPDDICALTNLEELSVRGELPCDFDSSSDDEDADISGDYGGAPSQAVARDFALPREFGQRLRKLRVLRLDCRPDMRELPAQVLQLTALESLDVSNTALTSLPENLGSALPRLTHLRAASCGFACVPAAVFGVPSLRRLDLGRNPRLEVGDLNRAQLAWLTSLGSLSLAKLGDCPWHRDSLSALALLELAAQRRRVYMPAKADQGLICAAGEMKSAAGEWGEVWSEDGGVCVLERLSEGCPSVGVVEADGQLVQMPLAL